ncbi:DoxX family protein [Streptomyces sp. NBC_00988]|uniref:DoxX family protein n=1 Tax=Streptomyces sp. NBC_00988 TaxID=2903704 RepID=UPI0038705ECB|nr:DoxX family protein [Streptomyces sp. NBC_00988]
MFIAAFVVSVMFALILLVSARGKLIKDPAQMKTLERVGFPEQRVALLAAAEIAGAGGILIGLAWWPLGVAAAIGIIAYFSGAIVSHLRVRDWQFAPAAVLLLAGVAALVLRLASR